MSDFNRLKPIADSIADYWAGEGCLVGHRYKEDLEAEWNEGRLKSVDLHAWAAQLDRLIEEGRLPRLPSRPSSAAGSQLLERPNVDRAKFHPGNALFQKMATEESWKGTFRGQALNALLEHLNKISVANVGLTEGEQEVKGMNILYARIVPCVQSSGTGKSRLFHEAAKCVFTIPLCLRRPEHSGIPPGDHVLLAYLRRPVGAEAAHRHWLALLTALFATVLEHLADSRLVGEPAQWSSFFTDGMSYTGHNQHRIAFYGTVIDKARSLLSSSNRLAADGSVKQIAMMTEALGSRTKALNKALREHLPAHVKCSLNLVLDEAHDVMSRELAGGQNARPRTMYSTFRSAARECGRCPITFSLLSTTSAVREVVPAREYSPSSRVESDVADVPPIFTLTGWDQCLEAARDAPAGNGFASLVRYGRPLFGFTYLAQPERMPVDLRETEVLRLALMKLMAVGQWNQVLVDNAHPDRLLALFGSLVPLSLTVGARPMSVLVDHQDTQVRHHLAILDISFQSVEVMNVIRPSEPVVALAAGLALQLSEFSLLELLGVALTTLEMSKAEKGELTAMVLFIAGHHRAAVAAGGCTLAQGQRAFSDFPFSASVLFQPVSLDAFLGQLLRMDRSDIADRADAAAMQGKVRVCQFVQREENSLPSQEDLRGALLRGCAFSCHFNQRGTDLIIPVAHDAGSVGAIFIEVKTRGAFSSTEQRTAHKKLLENKKAIFGSSGSDSPPCVAILFILGTPTPPKSAALHVADETNGPGFLAMTINGDSALSILNAGPLCSSTVKKAFCTGGQETLAGLLQPINDLHTPTPSGPLLRQSMNPLCGRADGYRAFMQGPSAADQMEAMEVDS